MTTTTQEAPVRELSGEALASLERRARAAFPRALDVAVDAEVLLSLLAEARERRALRRSFRVERLTRETPRLSVWNLAV